METAIMALTIEPRSEHAPDTQEILTKYGFIIKTRIGMHETNDEDRSQRGLIVLHLSAKKEQIEGLKKELLAIEGVNANYMSI